MTNHRRTFVVGVDATEEGGRALEWARAAAAPDDIIVALHVWDLPTMVGLDTATMIPVDQMGDVAQRGLVESMDRLGDARIEPVVRQGHAGRAIVKLADDRDADVIAVGHEGSGRASVVLGSTANHVVHKSDRTVVVVRGEGWSAPSSVVVGADDDGLDRSDDNPSVRALRFVAMTWSGAKFDVVHAGDAPDAAERVVASAALDPSVAVSTRQVDGPPETVLIEASRQADLVVVGSRGRGGFRGLLLGSTGLDLVSHSECPVAVVR